MASNQTANYGLNQWAAEDKVLREEFNKDNRTMEEALEELHQGALQIFVGQYTGTGMLGEQHPNTLTFSFIPQMVVIQEKSSSSSTGGAILLHGQELCTGMVTSHGLALNVKWEQTSVSWYSMQSYPEYQLNSEGQTYYYWAIG